MVSTLQCFYDNIVFAPFIFIEDPLDVNGQRGLLPEGLGAGITSIILMLFVSGFFDTLIMRTCTHTYALHSVRNAHDGLDHQRYHRHRRFWL